MKIKLAVFDVDGTLFDGNLGIEFIKILRQSGFSTDKIGKEIMNWYQKYKNGEVEKSVAVDEIYKLHALGMKGTNENEIKKIALETWQKINEKMYKFVPKLINFLKNKDYLVILLSGSPIEMIKVFGNELEIDEENIIAGEIEIIDEIYTGNIVSYPGSAEQKIEALSKLIEKRNIDIDWQNSVAMGDDERDLKVLEKAGHPMVINPSEKLKDFAQSNGWKIVDENNIFSVVAGEDDTKN